MPKKKQTKKFKAKKGNKKKKISLATINVIIVPLFIVLFLITFMVVQFLGERLRISPVLALGIWSWMTPGEAILLFVFWLSVSIVITVNVAFYLLKKTGRL